MISNSNEIYSDENESKKVDIESVCQLNENEIENENNLEELLRKSRQFISSKCERIIDQQIEYFPRKTNSNIENLILSCNQFGKSNQINWKYLPNHLHSLELSGNFISSLNGIENNINQLQSFGLSFNEIHQIDQIFSNQKWLNLCLLDLSYNLLNDLKKTIESLQNLNKLRILFLHGNPLSLLVDYRLYVVDSLEKLNVLDDITITAEERFRSRHFSKSNEHPKDYSQIKITFGTIQNVPMPIQSENEWPLQIHRYKMRISWFDGEKEDIDIPQDKFADFNRFNQSFIESAISEYKPTMDFSPNYLNLTIKSLIPLRDTIFHGTICQFIHQLTEYWQPGEPIEITDQKKKPGSNNEKDKKSDSPMKKKKNEDLSKLVTRKDPIETILAEFKIELRPFLDGDYLISFTFKSLLQQQIDSNNQQLNQIKPVKKKDSPAEKKKTSSSKSNEDKSKDKKASNENVNDPPPLPDPFQCQISFQLQRYISHSQII